MKNSKNLNRYMVLAIVVLSLISIGLGYLYFSSRGSTVEEGVNVSTDIIQDVDFPEDKVDSSDHLQMEEYLESISTKELTEEEIAGLIQMREEEKLAHDVYTTLYEMWGTKIFNNISNSEQSHTDSVALLLVRYEIKDPVTDKTVGVFSSNEMQRLYSDLVEQGSESQTEALKVGAIIEDLDIYDLEVLMAQTEMEDILLIYQNLLKGSRNHMRAFSRQLERNNTTYEPQFINQEEYNLIIGAPSENGVTYGPEGDAI